MAKRINKNMVAVLTGFGFVVMTVAAVLMILQLSKVGPENFVKLAEEYAAKDQFVEASLYYQRAYSVSEDEKFLVDMGEMVYQSGDEPKAADIWSQALTLEPKLLAAKEKLLNYHYEVVKEFGSLSQWRNTLAAAEAVLEDKDQDPFALFCKGRAQLALQGDDASYLDAGFEAMERAAELAPDNVEYVLSLALASRAAGRAEKAKDLFERLTQANSTPGRDAMRTRALWGRELASQADDAAEKGKANEAEALKAQSRALFDEALAMAGDDPGDQADARVYLAQALFRRDIAPVFRDPEGDRAAVADEVEQARKLLTEAIALQPDEFHPYTVLAELLRGEKRSLDAIKVLEERCSRDIDRKGLKGQRRKRDRYGMLLEAAAECIAVANTLEVGSQERNDMLGKARRFVLDARGEMPGAGRGLHAEGRVLLAEGKDLEALAKFEEADRAYDGINLENRAYMANLYLANQQVGAALQAIEPAVRRPGAGSGIWLTYARVLREAKEPSRAAEAAQRALMLDPDNRDIILVLADCFNDMDRPDLVQATLQKLQISEQENVRVRAQALMAERKFQEAVELLAPLGEANPGDIGLVDKLVGLYSRLGQMDQAKLVVERAQAADPAELYFNTLAIELDESLTDEERNARLLATIEAVDDEYERESSLATFYDRRQDWDKAVAHLAVAARLLKEGATPAALEVMKQRGEAGLRELVDRRFVILLMQKKWDEAEKMAAEAAQENLDAVNGLTFHGRIALMKGETERAVERFQQALQKRPNSSEVIVLLGQAYLDQDQPDQARECFEKAIQVSPNNGQAHKGLAGLAKKRGDVKTYQEHMGQCLRLIPDDEWVTAEREGLSALANPEGAIEKLLAEREKNPEDVKVLMQLGQLYVQTNKLDEAREVLDEVLKQAPQDLGVVNRVAEFYRDKLGNADRAVEIIQNALTAATEPKQQSAAHYLLAQHFMAQGQIERADAEFLAAADRHPSMEICLTVGRHFFTTGRPEMAFDWLEKAAAKAKEAADPALQSIENMRVEALMATKDYDRALAGVDRLLATYPAEGNVALMFRADIEAARGEIDKAVNSLTQYLEGGANKPLALFRRARYLALQGKWNLAITDLELLKAQQPDALELRPRKWLAIAYDRVGRYEIAWGELETLLQQNPGDQSLAEQLITLYLRHEDFDKAVRVVERLLTQPEGRSYWTFRRGQIVGERARTADDETSRGRFWSLALQDLRRAAEASPNDGRIVSAYLGACRETENYDAGIRFYEDTLKPEQRSAPTLTNYAGLLAKKGLAAPAVEQYRLAAQALVGQPDWAMYFRAVAGDALETLGTERAADLFRSPPDDERLARASQMLTAVILSAGGQDSEAATLFDQLLQAPRDDAEKAGLLMMSAAAAEQAGDNQRAKQCYEEVVKLESLNWVAYNNLAFLLCDKLGQCSEALPYAERAAKLANDPAVSDTLATVYNGLGRHRQAVGILIKVLQEDPTFVTGYVHLADAHRRLGEFKLAEDQLAEARKIIESDPERYSQQAAEIEHLSERVSNQDSNS